MSLNEMTFKKKQCFHNVALKLKSGGIVHPVKPLFSYDSQHIIVANGSNIKVFNIKSGECLQILKKHCRPIISIQQSNKNILQILSCSDDGIVVRWDYTGKILQVYDLKTPVANFFVPSQSESWYITKKYEDHYRLYAAVPKEKEQPKLRMIIKPVQPKENAIAFGFMGKYTAAVSGNDLVIHKSQTNTIIRHKTGEFNLTCVASSPTEDVLATGDDHGRIIVWTNALSSNHPIRSIYHWHTLPLLDVAFSSEGSHLYSGGGESVLVKWNLFNEQKSVLPRMGDPIERIVVSKDNSYVVTTHSDNVLQIVDAQRNIVQVIQGLTRSQAMYGQLLPVGLLYNTHLKALVMNGKPGHLQFYDIQQDKQMFNLDIASKNFYSQERSIAVHNIEVQKAALDDSGLWLATSEYWCNSDCSPQIWLKFWEFNLEKQTFVLNTNVYLPHNKELNCILFRPSIKHSKDLPLCVTTSNDGKLKMWSVNTASSDGKQSWSCEAMGEYRDLIPTSASFHEDGSLLAVAFGPFAIIWAVEGFTQTHILANKKHEKDIKQLLFARGANFNYLLCLDDISITAWNFGSLLKDAQTIYFETQLLTVDTASGNVAAFGKDQSLTIFKPNSVQPSDYIDKVSDSSILTATFVPSESCNNISGCVSEKSQLFFMDENQNLFTLTEPVEQDNSTSEKKSVAHNIVETPFSLLQAAQTVSHVKEVKPEMFSVSAEQGKPNIISNPTWTDPELVLKSLLRKLLIPKTKKEDKKEITTQSTQDPSDMEIDFTDTESANQLENLEKDWMAKALNKPVSEIDVNYLENFKWLTDKIKFQEQRV